MFVSLALYKDAYLAYHAGGGYLYFYLVRWKLIEIVWLCNIVGLQN